MHGLPCAAACNTCSGKEVADHFSGIRGAVTGMELAAPARRAPWRCERASSSARPGLPSACPHSHHPPVALGFRELASARPGWSVLIAVCARLLFAYHGSAAGTATRVRWKGRLGGAPLNAGRRCAPAARTVRGRAWCWQASAGRALPEADLTGAGNGRTGRAVEEARSTPGKAPKSAEPAPQAQCLRQRRGRQVCGALPRVVACVADRHRLVAMPMPQRLLLSCRLWGCCMIFHARQRVAELNVSTAGACAQVAGIRGLQISMVAAAVPMPRTDAKPGAGRGAGHASQQHRASHP